MSEPVEAYRAIPAGEGPWPGVVMVHEVWGVDEQMIAHADRLAGMGYLVTVPDLYARGGAARCMIGVFRALRSGHGPAFADLEATRRQLASDPRCTGRVGVLGFCMGGGFALMCAERGYDVAAPFYGQLPRDLTTLRRACPVVAGYGGADPALRGAARRLETALAEFGIPHDVKEYAGAGHSFMSTSQGGPAQLRPLFQAMNAGPHPVSAEHAWRRVAEFFGTHLQDEGR